MMKNSFQNGDVVSWQEKDVSQRTIAIIDDPSGEFFSVAIHHNGARNVDTDSFDMWVGDNIPADAIGLGKATREELVEMVWALIDQPECWVDLGPRFTVDVANRQIIFVGQTEEKAPFIFTDEINRWTGYLKELLAYYQQHESLKGASNIRDKYHVGGVTKEQFFNMQLYRLTPDNLDATRVCCVIADVKEARKAQGKKKNQ